MNHATCTVLVTPSPYGPLNATALEPLVAAVPVDIDTLLFLNCTLGSDTTIINGSGQVQRTIALNFTPAFKLMFPDASDQRKPFWGFMAETIAKAVLTRALAGSVILS